MEISNQKMSQTKCLTIKKVILKQNIQNKIKLINKIVISIDRRYIF